MRSKTTQKYVAPPPLVWLYPPVQRGLGLFFLPGSGRLWQIGAGQLTVNRQQMQIFYSGSVQGVGFRYTVKAVAAGYEVSGTVRNLADGRVHLVAEGSRGELEAFRQAIRDSGLDHFIRDERVSWDEAKSEFRGFEIVR